MISKLAARAFVTILVGGMVFSVADQAAVAAKVPVEVPESIWETFGLIKLTGGGASGAVEGLALVAFGPSEQLELAADEFDMLLLDSPETGIEVFGTYALQKPGKPVITSIDIPALEDDIYFWLDVENQLPGVTMEVLTASLKVKPKATNDGEEAKVQFKTKLQFCGDRCIKANLSYKGEGPRTELPPL